MTNLASIVRPDVNATAHGEPAAPAGVPAAAGPSQGPAAPGNEPRLLGLVERTEQVAELPRQAMPARHVAPVPRISVQAFHDTPGMVETIGAAAQDRLMSRVQMEVRAGGIAAAIELYGHAPSPNLILVETRAEPQALLAALDRLADVCDSRTKVLVIGSCNDIDLYREVLKRGISEYVVGPLDAGAVIAAVSAIFRGSTAEKLGQIYAFVGAKGGVGSSTIAHNVAWEITQGNSSGVILADLDLPFGTAGLDFDLDPGQGITDAIQDAGRLDDMLLERLLVKYRDQLSLLAASSRLDRPFDLDENAFVPLLELARSNVPFLVLDVPHVWTSWARKTLAAADKIVITAAPDLANLRNAKSIVDFLRESRPQDAPPQLVLNQVGVPKRPEIKPKDFAAALQIELIATIPFEPLLFGTAASKGQMIGQVSSKAVAALTLVEVAQLITDCKRIRARKSIFGSFSGLLRKAPAPALGAKAAK